MAERSFAEEVGKLRLGAGETFRGEGILAVTKALLESGVAYVAGYQGAPISHLMDVLADAEDILVEHGIRFENSASEATAAATLAASVNYPLRGAVTFKGPVGVNVASDALANLASGGVTGGALVIVGEDYGEGSSIMQERTHAFAMKSQIWLLDPRPNLPSIVAAVKAGFALSEASRTPVMLELRIRACHVHGQFMACDNVRSPFTLAEAMASPRRDVGRIVLPPMSYAHEREKIGERWPAALRFIEEHGLNEFIGADGAERSDLGIVVQGGHCNTVLRVLERLGLADVYGRSQLPIYVLNVAYPVVDREVLRFCEGKRAVLMVEEGQPNFIEQNVATILLREGSKAALHGKDILPLAGEYTQSVVLDGVREFLERYGQIAPREKAVARVAGLAADVATDIATDIADHVHARPPGFCTGCPERPIFSAMKLVERELGAHHVSADIGCHLFSILPPFHLGNTTMGYGLGTAGASAFSPPGANGATEGKRAISVMGDGGFWHNGLTSGIANAVFNRSDNLTIVVDNNYTSATGGQDLLSSKGANPSRSTGHAIERAVRGVGVEWVKTVTHTFDVGQMRDALREALTTKDKGPKVLVAQSECMLNRQRREKPLVKAAVARGERVVRERFGVDADTCTGDHSCIRLSGCPSLTIKENPDPLRTDPVAAVIDSCVGCGVCGEVSHAAVLCPSFYKARIVSNPTRVDRWLERARGAVIGALQARDARRRARFEIPALAQAVQDAPAPKPLAGAPSPAPQPVDPAQPIKIAILAIGGEGGGVLSDWIVELAERHGYIAQATSVPGVAQRTGATIYYVELFPQAAAKAARAAPVLALMPMPGDVDIVLASELMEAGRAVQRGLVTPDRTTLIASTHRVWSIAEKTAMGDGRSDGEALLAHARGAAGRLVSFDMARVAEDSGSVVSAVLFGALAASGALPFARDAYEETIAAGGVGASASRRAFDAGFASALAGRTIDAAARGEPRVGPASSAASAPAAAPSPGDPVVAALVAQARSTFPAEAQAIVVEGLRRTIDWQDRDYAALYLDRLARVQAAAPRATPGLVTETARHLALWMTYEDTVRVAALKTRATRFDRVRSEVRVGHEQTLAIDEYLHPRLQEICDTLPAALGRRLARPGFARRLVERLTARGRVVTTSSISGFLLLRLVAGLRRIRRSSLRFETESRRIEAWLERIVRLAAVEPALAVEVATCQRLVKGYGDTHERGWASFGALMAVVDRVGAGLAPAMLAGLREAALADENGAALRAALARHGLSGDAKTTAAAATSVAAPVIEGAMP